ncbi:MAG: hypothetical protein PWR26_99 [Methanosarcinales archaeon]|nr:hypothetical protein [Methanosarcinales archaeon]MDN5295287.1 hypothetical protein [Methanosarcinales archaeon]
MATNDLDFQSLKQTLWEDSDGKIVMFEVSAEHYVTHSIRVIQALAAVGEGIVVALSRPHKSMLRSLRKNDVNVENMWFVDAVSPSVGIPVQEGERVMFVESVDPNLLMNVITQFFLCISSEKRYIYLDSLATLAVYRGGDALIKFFRQITAKSRMLGYLGVVLAVEKELDEGLRAQIAMLCDDVISLT